MRHSKYLVVCLTFVLCLFQSAHAQENRIQQASRVTLQSRTSLDVFGLNQTISTHFLLARRMQVGVGGRFNYWSGGNGGAFAELRWSINRFSADVVHWYLVAQAQQFSARGLEYNRYGDSRLVNFNQITYKLGFSSQISLTKHLAFTAGLGMLGEGSANKSVFEIAKYFGNGRSPYFSVGLEVLLRPRTDIRYTRVKRFALSDYSVLVEALGPIYAGNLRVEMPIQRFGSYQTNVQVGISGLGFLTGLNLYHNAWKGSPFVGANVVVSLSNDSYARGLGIEAGYRRRFGDIGYWRIAYSWNRNERNEQYSPVSAGIGFYLGKRNAWQNRQLDKS